MTASVLALDLSLTSTGVARSMATAYATQRIRPTGRGTARLADIRDQVLALAQGGDDPLLGGRYRAVDLVVLEGYAYAGHQAHQLGELGGVIRVALHDAGIPWVAVPPATVKKLATGAGNAKKEQVLLAAVRRLGYTGDSNDEADALWLLEAARQYYLMAGRERLPQAHLAGLGGKTEWPRLPLGLAAEVAS